MFSGSFTFEPLNRGKLIKETTPPKRSKGTMKRTKGIMLTGVITERNILKNLEMVKSQDI
jgi:hypothetical protein